MNLPWHALIFMVVSVAGTHVLGFSSVNCLLVLVAQTTLLAIHMLDRWPDVFGIILYGAL